MVWRKMMVLAALLVALSACTRYPPEVYGFEFDTNISSMQAMKSGLSSTRSTISRRPSRSTPAATSRCRWPAWCARSGRTVQQLEAAIAGAAEGPLRQGPQGGRADRHLSAVLRSGRGEKRRPIRLHQRFDGRGRGGGGRGLYRAGLSRRGACRAPRAGRLPHRHCTFRAAIRYAPATPSTFPSAGSDRLPLLTPNGYLPRAFLMRRC